MHTFNREYTHSHVCISASESKVGSCPRYLQSEVILAWPAKGKEDLLKISVLMVQ